MKLVVFGLTISSAWGNGHATLWRGLCKSLARRGHRVVFFERDVPYYAQARDAEAADHCKLILYDAWSHAHARRELADADAAIVTSYCDDAAAAHSRDPRCAATVSRFLRHGHARHDRRAPQRFVSVVHRQ